MRRGIVEPRSLVRAANCLGVQRMLVMPLVVLILLRRRFSLRTVNNLLCSKCLRRRLD